MKNWEKYLDQLNKTDEQRERARAGLERKAKLGTNSEQQYYQPYARRESVATHIIKLSNNGGVILRTIQQHYHELPLARRKGRK